MRKHWKCRICFNLRENAGICGNLWWNVEWVLRMTGSAGKCGNLRENAGNCNLWNQYVVGFAGKCGKMQEHVLRSRFQSNSCVSLQQFLPKQRACFEGSWPTQSLLAWMLYNDMNDIICIRYFAQVLQHIILYYTILYYTILYYTILYYSIAYCTILQHKGVTPDPASFPESS